MLCGRYLQLRGLANFPPSRTALIFHMRCNFFRPLLMYCRGRSWFRPKQHLPFCVPRQPNSPLCAASFWSGLQKPPLQTRGLPCSSEGMLPPGQFPYLLNKHEIAHSSCHTSKLCTALQSRAVNEATFRCPDQDGWQPYQQSIDCQAGSRGDALLTPLPLNRLIGKPNYPANICAFLTIAPVSQPMGLQHLHVCPTVYEGVVRIFLHL